MGILCKYAKRTTKIANMTVLQRNCDSNFDYLYRIYTCGFIFEIWTEFLALIRYFWVSPQMTHFRFFHAVFYLKRWVNKQNWTNKTLSKFPTKYTRLSILYWYKKNRLYNFNAINPITTQNANSVINTNKMNIFK